MPYVMVSWVEVLNKYVNKQGTDQVIHPRHQIEECV